MKKCTKCNVEKELNEFGKGDDPKTGLQYKCKECRKNTIMKTKTLLFIKQKNIIKKMN